jgi:hypothetical protein
MTNASVSPGGSLLLFPMDNLPHFPPFLEDGIFR